MIEKIVNNRYKIFKEIGRGGFGITYLAQDTKDSNHIYVVKKLDPLHANAAAAKRLFKREANALKFLQEAQQIPKFRDYFEEDNHSYLVQEYIKGTTLDKLQDKNWDEEDICLFLWNILSVLETLHDRNIIHRDIKPSNLIQREKDFKVILIDFGAVKLLDGVQENVRQTCISSFGYAPPEQSIGQPGLNSDLYALGITAIQLLTKTNPREFKRDDDDNIIWNPQLNLDPSLTNILNKMVKNNPRERYQSVAQVFKAISSRDKTKHKDIPLTNVIPQKNDDQTDRKKLPILKLPYILSIAGVGIILISIIIEIVNPWMRPLYYVHQGNILLTKKQEEDAILKFNKALSFQLGNYQAWKGRGDALFTLKRYRGSLKAYEKSLSLQPKNSKLLNNIGKVYYQERQYTAALNFHQKALEIDSQNAEAWGGKGLAYLGLQDYQKSVESFDQAQAIQPNDPTTWLQKGIVLGYLNQPQEAAKFYQEALNVYNNITKNKPNNPILWTDRGFVLQKLNRQQEALESYEKALAVNENFYEALIGRANNLILLQQPQEAVSNLDTALKINPKDYQVWYTKGHILGQMLNEQQEALMAFNQAIELNDQYAPAWLGQGLTYMAIAKDQEALESFNRAKNLNPQNPYIWYNRGLVLENLQDYPEAFQSYEKAAQLGLSSARSKQESLKLYAR